MPCVHAVSVSLTKQKTKTDKGPFITFLIIYHYLLTYLLTSKYHIKMIFFNKPTINYDNEPPLLWIIVIYVNFTCICSIQFIKKKPRDVWWLIKVLSCLAWQYYLQRSVAPKKKFKKKNKVFQIKKRVFRLILVFILTDVRQKQRQFNLFFRWYYD